VRNREISEFKKVRFMQEGRVGKKGKNILGADPSDRRKREKLPRKGAKQKGQGKEGSNHPCATEESDSEEREHQTPP